MNRLLTIAVLTAATAAASSTARAQTKTSCNTEFVKKQVSRAVAAEFNKSDPYSRGPIGVSWPKVGSTMNITGHRSNHTAGDKTRGKNLVNLIRSGFKAFELQMFKTAASAGTYYICSYTYPGKLDRLARRGEYRRLSLANEAVRTLSAASRRRSYQVRNPSKKRLVTVVLFSPHSYVSQVRSGLRVEVRGTSSSGKSRPAGSARGSTASAAPKFNAEVESTAKFFHRQYRNSGYCFGKMGRACRAYSGGQQTGTPIDVVFDVKGRSQPLRAVKRDANGTTHCSGVTISIMSTLLRKHKLTRQWSSKKVLDFYGDWVGYADRSALGRKRRSVDALVKSGLGREITNWDDVRPGDFVELNRGGFGHSVIFQEWLTNSSGKRVGIYYLSSQDPTNGIGYAGECFDNERHPKCGRTRIANPQRNIFIGRFTGGQS